MSSRSIPKSIEQIMPVTKKDYYEILVVPKRASIDEIKKVCGDDRGLAVWEK